MTRIYNQSSSSRNRKIDEMRLSMRVVEEAGSTVQQVLRGLKTHKKGLTENDALSRLKKYGNNVVSHEKPPIWYQQLFQAFNNPFIYILLVLGIISFFTQDTAATIILTLMIVVSGLLRFVQEYRSTQAAEKLKAMVSTTAKVMRRDRLDLPGKQRELPIEELVPGDIIHLAAGDMIPADVRLLSSKDLFVSQAVLTGESLPIEKYNTLGNIVEKNADFIVHDQVSFLDTPTICFMGTNIVSGTAIAIVVATGDRTYFGSLAQKIIGKKTLTNFDKGIQGVSWLLISFMAVMVPIVFLINGLAKGNWIDAFFFAISIAVGLTPEMLPMIISANLARGAVVMSKQKVIIKHLNAIQNFGAMDILCTDKTGTLTQDKIILERHLDIQGNPDHTALKYGYLNSYYQTGLKNSLDVAVIENAQLNSQLTPAENYRKVDEIPFDFTRRRMSVVLEEQGNTATSTHTLICKGAVEEIFAICSHAEYENQTVPIDQSVREHGMGVNQLLNQQGFRVIAVAYKQIPVAQNTIPNYSAKDECNLTLVGYLAFLDPPKDSASQAIKALQEHGVTIKIITGDNDIVTRKICQEVDLHVHHTLLGREIENLSDEELAELVETTTVFAKMSPLQKARIIRILRHKNHTVGYLGDGINDAAALRDADVGISVDSAVDIAKQSADIILLEKNLMVLEQGVIEGRRTFGNILKYLNMTASSNFGNVFSVMGASAFLPFLPMQPIQLLIQNLLYDISQTSIPFDNVDPEFLKKPQKWKIPNIGRFMIFIGPVSSIFDFATYSLMWWIFDANTTTAADIQLFNSGWFIEGLLSQTLIIHMIRTARWPFFQSTAALPVIVLTIMIMALGIFIPFTPLGSALGMVPLPMGYFPWLVAILTCYCLLTQLIKLWYISKFKMWL